MLAFFFHGEVLSSRNLRTSHGRGKIDCSLQRGATEFPTETISNDRSSRLMARYYFHIDGQCPHCDEYGEDLPHDEAAWQAALRLMRDIEDGFRPGHTWRLDVHDGTVPVYLVEITTHRRR